MGLGLDWVPDNCDGKCIIVKSIYERDVPHPRWDFSCDDEYPNVCENGYKKVMCDKSSFATITHPSDSSFYVTPTSSRSNEFPNNFPSHFQCRFPQALWLTGKWKVGLASLYLPGAPNPIPHVVTSHSTIPSHSVIPAAPQPPQKQFSYKRLSNLYKGTSTDIMFQQYAKAFKSSQSQEFLCKLNKVNLPYATTGFDFYGRVVRRMDQDLNKKLLIGYQFAYSNDRWRVDITAQDNNRFGCYVITILTVPTVKVSPI